MGGRYRRVSSETNLVTSTRAAHRLEFSDEAGRHLLSGRFRSSHGEWYLVLEPQRSPLTVRSGGNIAKKILLTLSLLLVLFLLLGSLLPGSYSVTRTLFIEAQADRIHALLADLRSWPEWTPWNQQLDPTVRFQFSGAQGVGSSYSWQGDQLGKGVLEITSSERGRGVVYLLRFEGTPPADGVIQITPMKGGCEVLWKMSGDTSRPLGPYLVPMMDSFIGDDLEQCLKGLQEQCR